MEPTPIDPGEAERRFAELLDEALLPRFATAHHDAEFHQLALSWEHGLTIYIDLDCPDLGPLDTYEREAILDVPYDQRSPTH